MIAIGIRYLCGWAMATHPADRARSEWPPHPDRVFMALAAAHFETGEAPDERDALEWLERHGPPLIVASDASAREIVTSYVPVNDAQIPRWNADKEPSREQQRSGLALLPEFRWRQPRSFPVAIPDDDSVFLVWPSVLPTPDQRESLAALCRKVTCIGHSASLVQVWIEDQVQDAHDLAPTDGKRRVLEPEVGPAPQRLRIAGPGRLESLRARFTEEQRPTAGLWIGYREAALAEATAERGTVFDPNLIVLRISPQTNGRRLGLESTLLITAALRRKLLDVAGARPAEWVTGQKPDGRKSDSPHMAFVPLAHVGREHADGHLLGVAMVLPRGVAPQDKRQFLADVLLHGQSADDDSWPLIRVSLGESVGDWELQVENRELFERPVALRAETWIESWRSESRRGEAARTWATVTPIVLDRHPKTFEDTAEIIATACERVTAINGDGGLRPECIDVRPVSRFTGVGHARRDFPPLPQKFGKSVRSHVHATMTFAMPIRGPLLLGAGRYLGYGFCRPLTEEEMHP
jgi:CRISPR-associated protein Csb2